MRPDSQRPQEEQENMSCTVTRIDWSQCLVAEGMMVRPKVVQEGMPMYLQGNLDLGRPHLEGHRQG